MNATRKPGRLRIIGGKWRSRIVEFSEQDGVRPTPDRVRQTLFDWVAPRIEGARCLDLFAGSGAMGLEALSRGASHVSFVDRGRAQTDAIRSALSRLQGAEEARVICADASAFVAADHERYNLIFVDPPYQSSDLAQIVPKLESHLALDHRVYVEWAGDRPEFPAAWEWLREKRAGRVSFGLLRFGRGETT